MGSALGYALTGAAAGLGDEMLRRAEDKRAMARELLKQRGRQAERADDRKLEIEDRGHEEDLEAKIRKEKRENTVEDLGIREAGLDRRSRRRGLGKDKPISLTDGLLRRMERQFRTRGDEPDFGIIAEVEDQTRRILEEARDAGEEISQDEAYSRARAAMLYEEDVTEGTILGFGGTTTTKTNQEGRGKFIGFDFDGAPAAPSALGGGGAVDISQIPPEAIEFLKQNPGLRADFDAQFGPGSAAAVLD